MAHYPTASTTFQLAEQLPGDAASAFPNSEQHLAVLHDTIQRKIEQTQRWVDDNYNCYEALFLLDAERWQHFPAEVQALGGQAMATVLKETYPPDGQGYPLPEYIEAPFNTKVIASGVMRPYFVFLVPKALGLRPDLVYADPTLLLEYQEHLVPVAVSAQVVNSDGSVELGRSARRPGTAYNGVRAGALILQSYVDAVQGSAADWHAVHADVRAARGHTTPDGKVIQSSLATQEEYFRRVGLSPTMYVPAYVVGKQLEPFVMGRQYTDGTWLRHLDEYTVYTPDGPHVALLQALSECQTGQRLPLSTVAHVGAAALRYCSVPALHGNTVYAKVIAAAEQSAASPQGLEQTVNDLYTQAPSTIVSVPAHNPDGAVTQQLLLEQGFTICGFEPAHDETHDGATVVVPPMVHMARLGVAVVSGVVPLTPAQFPGDIYGTKLREAFEHVDSQFRQAIMAHNK